MGRIFPLSEGGIGSSYLEGEKHKNDQLYRQAMQDLQYANARKDAEEFASTKLHGYRSPVFNDKGLFTDYKENTSNIARNKPILEKNFPQYFSTEVSPAVPEREDPAVAIAREKSNKDAAAAAELEDRINQNTPVPKNPIMLDIGRYLQSTGMQQSLPQKPNSILEDPKKDTSEFIGEPKSLAPGLLIQPQKQSFNYDDRNVIGDNIKEKILPAIPAVKEALNPTPEMLAGMQTRMLAAPQKDSEEMIPVLNLPQSLRDKLGIEPTFKGSIPSSLLKEMIQGSYRATPTEKSLTANIDPIAYNYADQVRNGVPLGRALGAMQVELKRQPTKEEVSLLRGMAGMAAVDTRTRDTKSASLEQKKEQDFDKAIERFGTAYEKTGILQALPVLERIEQKTGALSSDNPDTKSLPGYATNIVRSIPIVGQGASTAMAKQYGGEEMNQALQVLLNAQIRTQSGQAVTKYEEGRNLIATGMGPGGNEKDIVRGLRLMMDGLREADRSVRAKFDPMVTKEYEKRGGNLPLVEEIGKRKSKAEQGSSEFQGELARARRLMGAFRESLQQQMLAGKMNTKEASRQVEERKKQVNDLLMSKYGKGYSDGQ